MALWFRYALFALMFYGLWGFFPKLATKYLSSRDIVIYEVVGIVIAAVLAIMLLPGKTEWHLKGVVFSIITGIAGIIGTYFFLQALRHGKASVVILLTSLYPMISVALAMLILRETMSFRQLMAGLFAICSLVLFAIA